jgi:hypothetical protein
LFRVLVGHQSFSAKLRNCSVRASVEFGFARLSSWLNDPRAAALRSLQWASRYSNHALRF